MSEFLFLNNEKIESNLPLRSLFYGEGVFETTRWKGKEPLYIKSHLKRLRESAMYLDIPYPGDEQIRKQAQNCYKIANIEDAYLKICILSDGDTLFYERPKTSSILIFIKEQKESKFTASLCVSEIKRNQNSRLANIKTFNFLEGILVKREAIKRGFDDAIILNTKDEITETSSNNIFWVRGKSLFTPSVNCGLLPGITRDIVITMASELGYDVNERKYKLPYLLNSDFAFLTNASHGMLYVNKINNQSFTPIADEFHKFKNLLYSKLGW